MISHCNKKQINNSISLRGIDVDINGMTSGSERGLLDHRTSWARSAEGQLPTNSYRIEQGYL